MSESVSSEAFEFKNEVVHSVVTCRPACRIECKIRVFPPLIEVAKRQAVKEVGKDIELPGFRKGRAPTEMIEKKFPERIEKAFHTKLANAAFAETQKMAKIPILNGNTPITFEVKSLSEQEADLFFFFETEPHVPLVDATLFQPTSLPHLAVTEQQVDEMILQMRFYFAEWKSVERPIQEGDYVVIDLDTTDQDPPQRVFHSVRFEVSRERMATWMRTLIVGAKKGDVLDGVSEPDEQGTEQEKQDFQPKKVRLFILNVEEALLPELNEELAQKVGVRDLVHLRQSVTDLLRHQVDQQIKTKHREQVNAFLMEKYPFDLPQSLVSIEVEHRLRTSLQNARGKQKWEESSKEEKEAVTENLKREAIHALRLFYLARKVVQEGGIGITNKEIQDEAISLLKAHAPDKKVSVDKISKELYAISLSKVLLTKAQDYILSAKNLT